MLWIAGLTLSAAGAQTHAIDTAKSVITIRVYKTGILSALGHDHEITAPIAAGSVDDKAHKVEFHVEAGALLVRDPQGPEKDRAEVQKTMLGPGVLDSERYAEIAFRSASAEPAGEGAWKVSGTLTLHGQSRPVTVAVKEAGGHYTGSASLKQTEFGIKPARVGGGAVRVKDELRIEFDIQLAR